MFKGLRLQSTADDATRKSWKISHHHFWEPERDTDLGRMRVLLYRVCVCVCVCMHARVSQCVCAFIVYVCMHACVHVCQHVYVSADFIAHVCVHVCVVY